MDFMKLLKEPWDLIVNTHYLPTELIASQRRKQELKTPQFVVTTDFDTHRLWVHDPVERTAFADRHLDGNDLAREPRLDCRFD